MAIQWVNSQNTYGWVSIALHWVSAFMVFCLLISGVYMVTLSYYDPLAAPLSEWHGMVGVLLAGVSILRVLWSLLTIKPVMNSNTVWLVRLAFMVHGMLYLLLFTLLITGYFILTADGDWLTVFGQKVVPGVANLTPTVTVWVGESHRWLAYAFGALIVLHGLAALKHHFLERDNTLRRILYPQR